MDFLVDNTNRSRGLVGRQNFLFWLRDEKSEKLAPGDHSQQRSMTMKHIACAKRSKANNSYIDARPTLFRHLWLTMVGTAGRSAFARKAPSDSWCRQLVVLSLTLTFRSDHLIANGRILSTLRKPVMVEDPNQNPHHGRKLPLSSWRDQRKRPLIFSILWIENPAARTIIYRGIARHCQSGIKSRVAQLFPGIPYFPAWDENTRP